MIGVFNNSARRGAAVDAVILGIAEGAKTLDCIDSWLVDYYKQFGFVEKERVKRDDEQAPDGWEYSTGGRPDVVFFEYLDDLGREPADVARRFKLAGGGQYTGGIADPGGNSTRSAEDGERARSGAILGGEETPPGTIGTAPDVLDGKSFDILYVKDQKMWTRLASGATVRLVAEEMKGKYKINLDDVTLYDICL